MLNPRLTQQPLEIYLLGTFRAKVGGVLVEECRWLRTSAKLLVKLLALRPQHRLHRVQAMNIIWAEHDPETDANNLNKAIYMRVAL